MFAPTALEPARLADEFWLSAHDGGFANRATLSPVTRSLGLAGAFLVELIDGGLLRAGTGRPGSRHQPLSTDRDTTLLFLMPGYDKIKDQALRQVYEIVARNSDVPYDATAPLRPPPSWLADSHVQANYRSRPNGPAPMAAAHGSGIPVRTILEFLAIENRAEQLVVNRLLTTGLVRYETRRRLFGSETKVIVPADSVISGRALARVIAGLHPGQPYSRRPDADPDAPRGLTEFDKRMAALFAAVGVFDMDQTGLTGDEMRVLRAQVQTGIPAPVTAVLREVSVVIKSFALNR